MFSKLNKRMKGEGGFTLIELLVVIIIIAILAAIAIPTFLGQRQKAQDAAAKSLVRNAMTAVESTYVDIRDFSVITGADIMAVEPSITIVDAAPADAQANQVLYTGTDEAAYSVESTSQSGNTFIATVDKGPGGSTVLSVLRSDGTTASNW